MTKLELKKMTKSELVELAKDSGVKGYSKLKKDDLIEAIMSAKNAPVSKKKDEDIKRKPRKKKDSSKIKSSGPVLNNTSDTMKGESKKFEIEDKRVYLEPSYELVGDETYELPTRYGDTKITLMVQDPYWVHAYWEVNEEEINNYGLKSSPVTLRVFNASNGESTDIEVSNTTENWYFNVPAPGNPYYVELGVVQNGKFLSIVKSNTINVPSDKPASVYDESWISDEKTKQEELFKSSGGYVIHKLVGSQSFSEWGSVPGAFSSAGSAGLIMSSGGSGSGGVAGKVMPQSDRGRKFWAELHTELIVYGATEPDAKATVGGVPVKLTPNGTFSIRFYLKDGDHSVPFVATSNDEIDTIEITPFVGKRTVRKEYKNK